MALSLREDPTISTVQQLKSLQEFRSSQAINTRSEIDITVDLNLDFLTKTNRMAPSYNHRSRMSSLSTLSR